jgi:hypothetical protein
MIMSRQHRFVFMHNPKVGGTSVRKTLDRFGDAGICFWGRGMCPDGTAVDRAHIGIAEFARYHPDLWEQARDYAFFSLSRDPQVRFFSSMSEHSKHHGRIDMRFATPAQRKAVLFEMIARLEALGTAEALLPHFELTHFRPQHIYWRAPGLSARAQVWPLDRIGDFFAHIEARVGTPLEIRAVNQREIMPLPWPLRQISSQQWVKKTLRAIPGGAHLKGMVRDRFKAPVAGGQIHDEGYGLTPAERDTVTAFVQRFYARDIAALEHLLPPPAAPRRADAIVHAS